LQKSISKPISPNPMIYKVDNYEIRSPGAIQAYQLLQSENIT